VLSIIAARLEELERARQACETLITVDFAGEYDDRRGLEAVMGYIERRRVELEEESNGQAQS
jgi:hypothetical protein